MPSIPSALRNRTLMGVFVGVCTAGSAAALGADAGPADRAVLDEVTVTATRQGSQSVQTVPIAISVVSPTDLDAKGLNGVSDFARTLPSVNMQSQSPGVNSIEMRGVVTSAPDITTLQDRSLTSVYLDDAPISIQTANPDLKVFDLERIEVIRGPQGTLFGAGSMSGTIRLITRKPDSHNLSASSDVSVSETEHGGTNYSVRGSLNIPILNDQLAMRIGVYRGEDSGHIDNIQLGRKDANDTESTQGRVAFRWTPNETLTLDASAIIARLTSHGNDTTYPELGKYTYESLTPERFDDDFKLYNLTADVDVSLAHLIASASYQNRRFNDLRSFQYFDEALITPDVLLPVFGYQSNTVKDATQEVRLVSNPGGKLKWIVGAFHEQYHRNYPQEFYSPGFDSTIANLYSLPGFDSVAYYGTPRADDAFFGTIDVRERQLAFFGEATYEVLPKLNVTAGARYFDFRQDFDLFFTGLAGTNPDGSPLTRNGQQKSKGANPRAVVSYQATDSVLVYTQAARGFRYGGVNLPVPLSFCANDLASAGLTNAPSTFGPDNLWNYEIGEKGQFLQDKLLLNVTGFYIDWRDVQTTFPLQCGYPFIENKGRIKSQGVELETKARVTNQLTVSLNGSFTDARANGPLVNLGAPDGARVPFFPRLIVGVGGDYLVPLPGTSSLRFSADWTYRSDAYTEFNLDDPTTRRIPSSTMLNGTVTYAFKQWELSVYGTNLTDNLQISAYGYPVNRYAPYQPGDQVYIGRPRTVGLRVHYALP